VPSCSATRTVFATTSNGMDGPHCGSYSWASSCASLTGALASGAASQSFATIALDGGIYEPAFTISLTGFTLRPMTSIEGSNGELVIFDGNAASTLLIEGGLVSIEDIVFINGAPAVSVAEQTSGLQFTRCTFMDNIGTNANGQAVRLQLRSSAIFNNCIFHNNIGVRGSAIYSQFATMVLNSCTFSNNSASLEGGAVYALASGITSTGSTFLYNTASIQGGAISALQGSLTVVTTIYEGNEAPKGGAIEATGGATMTIYDCPFTSNIADSLGGAIDLDTNPTSTISIISSTFTSNSAPVGGAIATSDTSLILTECYFTGNKAITSATDTISSGIGGSVSCTQTGESTPLVTVSGSTFINGEADYGAVIATTLCTIAIGGVNETITNFNSNQAIISGGVIFASSAVLVLNDSSVVSNVAGSLGGVIAATSSNITTRYCEFTTNSYVFVPPPPPLLLLFVIFISIRILAGVMPQGCWWRCIPWRRLYI
jgi:predicted outer membrane repeat protein